MAGGSLMTPPLLLSTTVLFLLLLPLLHWAHAIDLSHAEELRRPSRYASFDEEEHAQHLVHLRKRRFTECTPAASSDNATHTRYPAHLDPKTPSKLSSVHARRFIRSIGEFSWEKHDVLGHVYVAENPGATVSVLEPGGEGGCERQKKSTVLDTIEGENCIVAINAGLFDTHTSDCLGNVVSDGRLVKNSGGIMNAHIGITHDDQLFFGYIGADMNLTAEFKQLVGGVIWLVKNSTNYVHESLAVECADTQETGTLEKFVDVQSARTGVGSDKDGRLIVVHVDGQTGARGVNLNELADMMIDMGAVDAINFDGGGSSTFVERGIVINYPSDRCKDKGAKQYKDTDLRCSRAVSTVLCVRADPCDPVDCSGHGSCGMDGKCECSERWRGDRCDEMYCGDKNCSGNGECTQDGCVCAAGWYGVECEAVCGAGTYGPGCTLQCDCQNGGVCRAMDGGCDCAPGYTGFHCEHECAHGLYGENCEQLCYCEHGCGCHHITGSCDLLSSKIWQIGECVADYVIKERHLVVDHPDQVRMWIISLVVLSVFAGASMLLNIALLCYRCTHSNNNNNTIYTMLPWKQSKDKNKYKQAHRAPRIVSSSSYSSHDESDIEMDNAMELREIKQTSKYAALPKQATPSSANASSTVLASKHLSADVLTPIPIDLNKDSHKDLPKDLHKKLPKDLYKDLPEDLPIDSFKNSQKDSPIDPLKDSSNPLPKDPPMDYFKDSLERSPIDSFKGSSEDSAAQSSQLSLLPAPGQRQLLLPPPPPPPPKSPLATPPDKSAPEYSQSNNSFNDVWSQGDGEHNAGHNAGHNEGHNEGRNEGHTKGHNGNGVVK